ncbi:ABC transporter substrate-binding protein [Phaeovulum sp.]|uniref:ABC transporter substrate-binding protein n=1 Tax=Phaeovulum sp. TaxID=2934796 RepID=UPI0039E609DB
MNKAIGLLTTSLLAIAAAGTAQARDLTFASWGGNYQDAQRAAYFEPFSKSKGIAFVEDTYLGGLAEFKTMADTGNVIWDVVSVEAGDIQVGCDEGLFEEIDWDTLGGKEDLLPAAVRECGAGTMVVSTGLAYNADSVTEAPANWADFFNTEKWPGKRGLRAGPKYNLEFALLADGAAPDEIYDLMATPEGLDRAFAKLDTIKQDLQFWDAGAQPVEWLAAGNVVMSSSYNGRITSAQDDGKKLKFVWTNNGYSIDTWAIPANSPNKELAMEFLQFANTAEPQAEFSTLYPYGPTNVKVAAMLPPEVAANIPAGDNVKDAFVLDDAFWIDNNDQIAQRWNNWVTQ